MPFLLPFVPAIIGAGVGLYAANQAGNAADKSLAAQTSANQASLADQQAARDNITRLEQPFVNAGTAGLSPLLQRIGVNSGQTQGVGINDPATANLFDRARTPAPPPNGVGAPVTAPGANDLGTRPAPAGPPQPTGQVPANAASNSFPASTPANGPPQAASTAAPTTAGQPDWDAYIQANPDVAAWIQQGHGDPSLGPNQTPEQAAAYQFQNTGQTEGRAPPPTTAAAAPQAPGQADPNAPPPTWQGMETDSSGAPIYSRSASGTAPSVNDFFSNFTASPGYQWRLDQGQRNLNAGSAARGLGQSGSAIKGAIDYGQNQASAEYGNWFNQQQTKFNDTNNQFNTANARTDANYASDRGYGTDLFVNERNNAQSRYDTNTGNLFSLAQMGQNAAGATGSAGQAYANNATNINGSQANAAANAAQQRAQANSQGFGALGAAAGNIFSTYQNGSTSGNIGTPTQPSYAGGY